MFSKALLRFHSMFLWCVTVRRMERTNQNTWVTQAGSIPSEGQCEHRFEQLFLCRALPARCQGKGRGRESQGIQGNWAYKQNDKYVPLSWECLWYTYEVLELNGLNKVTKPGSRIQGTWRKASFNPLDHISSLMRTETILFSHIHNEWYGLIFLRESTRSFFLFAFQLHCMWSISSTNELQVENFWEQLSCSWHFGVPVAE